MPMKEPEFIEAKEKLFGHFGQCIRLSPALKADLADKVAIIHFRKGDTVHDMGRVCRESFFIQRGLLRTYYALPIYTCRAGWCCRGGSWQSVKRTYRFR